MRNWLSSVAILLLATAACAPPAQPPAPAIDLAAERSALMAADYAWYEAFSGGATPLDGLLSAVAEDARFQSAGNPPAHGRDQIRAMYEPILAIPGFSLKWSPIAAEVSSGGDLGYTVGTYEMHMDLHGEPATETGHYVTIWRKQKDGAWKVVFDGGGPDAPAGV